MQLLSAFSFTEWVIETALIKESGSHGWDTCVMCFEGVHTSDPLDPSLIRLLPATGEGWGPKSLSTFKSPL